VISTTASTIVVMTALNLGPRGSISMPELLATKRPFLVELPP
jgi:hypothetical protein